MIFIPHNCIICNNLTKRRISLCDECEEELPWQGESCSSCGEALGASKIAVNICGRCLKSPPPFDSCQSLFNYGDVIRDLIADFKYRNKFTEGKVLAELLAIKFASYYENLTMPQLLIPVPLHRKKLKERGYNQSVELAREISRQCKLKIDVKSCRRSKFTQAQQGLDIRLRKANVQNAFELSASANLLKIKSVAIIDDVVTTTATVRELSQVLKSAGIEYVDVWCVARASLNVD